MDLRYPNLDDLLALTAKDIVDNGLSLGFYLTDTKKLHFSTYDVFTNYVFQTLSGDETFDINTSTGSIVGTVVHTTALNPTDGEEESLHGVFLKREIDEDILIVIGIPMGPKDKIFKKEDKEGKTYTVLKSKDE